jgi:hypothetical protein
MMKQSEFYGRSVYIDATTNVDYHLSVGIVHRYRTLVLSGASLVTVGIPDANTWQSTGGPILTFINITPNTLSIYRTSDGGMTTIVSIPAGAKAKLFLVDNSTAAGKFKAIVVAGLRSYERLTRPSIPLITPTPTTTPSCLIAQYILTNCADGTDIKYTNANMTPYIGKVVVTYQYPDTCYSVAVWNDIATTPPVAINVAVDDVGKAMVFDICTDCTAPTCKTFDDPSLPTRLQWVNYLDLFLAQAITDYIKANFNAGPPNYDKYWTGGLVLDRSGGQPIATYMGDKYNDGSQPTRPSVYGNTEITLHPNFLLYIAPTAYTASVVATLQCMNGYTPPGFPLGNYWVMSIQSLDHGVIYNCCKPIQGGKIAGTYLPFPATGPHGYNNGSGPYHPANAVIEVIG